MKREDVLKLFPEATPEQLKALLDINGADVEKAKGGLAQSQTEYKTAQETIEKLTKELGELKKSNATAEDYKQKFEELTRTVEADKQKAEEEQRQAEKAAKISERFNAACVSKEGKPLEFSHAAIKSDYLRRFGEALEQENNVGKSDGEIFHELTKDDSAAFKGVTVETLAGASPMVVGGDKDEATLRKAMGLKADKGE